MSARAKWTFEYDADCSGDPPAYHTTQAAVYAADGRCVVEEPGPDVTWRELQELVEDANKGALAGELGEALRDIRAQMEARGGHHDTCSRALVPDTDCNCGYGTVVAFTGLLELTTRATGPGAMPLAGSTRSPGPRRVPSPQDRSPAA